MNQFSKVFALLMAALFLWAAYLQLNDPDPGTWIPIYGVAALGSVLFALGKLKSWVGLLLGIAYVVGAFLYWPESFAGVTGNMDANHNIELGRESLGLAITALVFFFYSWRATGRRIS